MEDDDIKLKLQRAAAGAVDPEDRAWAAAKYQEMYGTAPAKEGVPEMLKRPSMDPMDAAMQRREQGSGVGDMLVNAVSAAPMMGFLRGRKLPSLGMGFGQSVTQNSLDELGGGVGAAASVITGNLPGLRPKDSEGQPVAFSTPPEGVGSIYRQGRDKIREYDRQAMDEDPTGYLEGSLMGLAVPTPFRGASAPGRIAAATAQGGMASLMGSDADLTQGQYDQALSDTTQGMKTSAGIATGAEALRGVTRMMPMVRKFAEAKDAGRIPAAKALPKGQEGITRASEQARDTILARKGDIEKQGSAAYGAVVEPAKKMPAKTQPIRDKLQEIRAQNTMDDGTVVDEVLDAELAKLEAKTLSDRSMNDVLKLRKSLEKSADFGNTNPSDKAKAHREIYHAFRDGVRATSDEVAQADDAFSAMKEQGGVVEQVMGGKVNPKDPKSMRRAAAELEHAGNSTTAAHQRQPGYDQMSALDPGYREAMKQMEAKRALEATRLFTTEPGTRTGLGQAVEHLPGGMPLQLLMQYGRGLGRIADQNVVPALQGIAPRAPLSLDILDALMRRRQQEQDQ